MTNLQNTEPSCQIVENVDNEDDIVNIAYIPTSSYLSRQETVVPQASGSSLERS